MGYQGPQFYDDDAVFEAYVKHRHSLDSPNNTLEGPLIRALLGDVAGHDVIDLGCGDARFGRELLSAGAASYVGIDGSRNMVAAANENLRDSKGRVVLADLSTWDPAAGICSRVCSRLVLHYLPRLEPIFQNIQRALRPDGLLVFSVEHPVITSSDRAWNGKGLRQEWIVDRYFDTGERVNNWIDSQVIKYHRTIEDYFLALTACGFRVESVRESKPVRSNFQSEEDFVRRQRIPLFLLMLARRI